MNTSGRQLKIKFLDVLDYLSTLALISRIFFFTKTASSVRKQEENNVSSLATFGNIIDMC